MQFLQIKRDIVRKEIARSQNELPTNKELYIANKISPFEFQSLLYHCSIFALLFSSAIVSQKQMFLKDIEVWNLSRGFLIELYSETVSEINF